MDEFLFDLEALIADRQRNPRAGSYTSTLFDLGTPRIAQKVGEEAVEVVVATLRQGREEQIGEMSDLLFHLLVLMRDRDIALGDVLAELKRRHDAGGASTTGTSAPSG